MQSTMNLLEAALSVKPAPAWHEELNLSRNALHTARSRGHLSPAILCRECSYRLGPFIAYGLSMGVPPITARGRSPNVRLSSKRAL